MKKSGPHKKQQNQEAFLKMQMLQEEVEKVNVDSENVESLEKAILEDKNALDLKNNKKEEPFYHLEINIDSKSTNQEVSISKNEFTKKAFEAVN